MVRPPKTGHSRKPTPGRVGRDVVRQQRLTESRVYGENACHAVFSQRPEAIVRAYFNDETAPRFAECMQYLAAQRRAYKLVDDAELERVASSQHHNGVVMVVKKRVAVDAVGYVQRHARRGKDCVLAFDGVANPHNVGAIMRTCAHFGMRGLLLSDVDVLTSGAAARVAEGGAEFVESIAAPDMLAALKHFAQAGYALVTTSSHSDDMLYQSELPAKMVIVLGEEMHGVSKRLLRASDLCLAVPGAGVIESLNVSVAAAVVMGEWFRQHQMTRSL
jgi:RNA methyltransferase, TrmH family